MSAVGRQHAAALALSALVLASLAACVSESGSGGSTDAQGNTDKSELQCGAATGEAATGTPIKVRAVATASGGVDFSSSPTAAQAYFDCVNDNGGIDGHPIDYAFEDDALNPTNTAQIAAGFAADDDVVALVGDATFVGCDVANAEYANAGLYSITGVGVPQACFQSSNIAPVNAGPRNSAIMVLQQLQEAGDADRVFQIGLNTQGNGDWVAEGINAYADANGIDIVGEELSDPSESNWLPLLQKIKDADPTAVIIADPAPITAAILAAAEQQDMKGDIVWGCTASCYDAQFGDQIGDYWEGFRANSELALVDAEGEDNELWRSVMDAYAPDDAPRDTFSQAGFLSAKIFTETLQDAGLSTFDRPSVSAALLGVTGYQSDLLCSPWYFGEAPTHNANHDTRMAEITDGAYTDLADCETGGDPALAATYDREQAEGLVG